MEIMNVVKKKKKKGFTLIELIAVIAILAILGVILVPKLSGYTAKANQSKDLANAKQLVQSVELYNQDHPDAQLTDVALGTATTGAHVLLEPTYLTWPKDPKTKTAGSITSPTAPATPGAGTIVPATWDTMTITTLRAYATALEQ